jgi:hypothetical protein
MVSNPGVLFYYNTNTAVDEVHSPFVMGHVPLSGLKMQIAGHAAGQGAHRISAGPGGLPVSCGHAGVGANTYLLAWIASDFHTEIPHDR